MKHSKNTQQSGFSLIEVLVVTALMAITSAAMMTMVSDQNKANKSTQLTIEANEVYNRIQRYMLDSAICGETLNGLVVAPGGQAAIDNIRKGGNNLISINDRIGDLTLTSMQLTRKTGALNLEFDLLITLQKINRAASFGSETIGRTVTLQAKINPSVADEIIGCFSHLETAVDTAVQESCDSVCPTLPATVPSACWNNTLKKCVLPPVAPTTALNLYQSSTGLTLSQPTAQRFTCSNCGSNCNPCPGGWTQLSNSCRMTGNCGFRRWRDCAGMCINGSPTPVGQVFPP
jgi:prepilin-type N-terminal cleavage/methylation domain-containing protein